MARADRPVRSDKEERRSDGIGHTIRSVEERREAVLELSFDGLSNRAITDVLGVDHATVLIKRSTVKIHHISMATIPAMVKIHQALIAKPFVKRMNG